MRTTRIAFIAILIAAAACKDATSPAASSDSLATARRFRNPKLPSADASSTAPASLYNDYSPTSPHWSHISTMMTDFYYGWTPAERAWAGAHYDLAMSGSGAAWRGVNSTVAHYPYALSWTMVTTASGLASAYYTDMKSWYAAHPQYALEKAFVHKKGSIGDSASRVFFSRWGSHRWAINPSDPGAIAYSVSRVQRLVGSESGVFFDESSTGDIGSLPANNEFANTGVYYASLTRLIAAIRAGLGGKRILLNLATYMTDADYGAAIVAGGVHLEMFNSFKYSGMIQRWQWMGRLTAAGVFVDFVSAYSSQNVAAMGTAFPRGNSASGVQRAKLWELASYYMAAPPSPKLFALQLENEWSSPYSTLWIKAQEANIGHPVATRVQLSHGTDPAANAYVLYNRDFDRALVVLRMQQGWNAQSYGDASAITVALPSGERWIPLNADGTVGLPVTSLRLRNSEAAILLKGSKM